MTEYQTHEHDVLIIGAGGAGLGPQSSFRGRRSCRLVCKSLLGKAHTVMAEGGIAAALANVDERDNWRVHFADTMRGGQYVNNWRMAQLHAQEAPARFASSRPGARCSTARPTAASCSGTSAGTATRGWPTSATAPAWS